MSRIAYVNGRYVPHRQAEVHIEDRGYQFADGVYEVIAVRGGHFVDQDLHLKRLARSLAELRMAPPMADAALRHILREVVRRNRVTDGIVYLQATRGVAPRDHAFPKSARTSLVATAKNAAPKRALQQRGVAVVTIEDIRWKRTDIKSIALLPNVLGKQQASEAGAYEAWMVAADGTVTEGTSTNAWLVTRKNELVTRAADHSILNGVTRQALIALAAKQGYRLVERPFSIKDALTAAECFLTSTTSAVMPVIKLDGKTIGDGAPGKLTRALQSIYATHEAGA
ncbi:MAG: D-amino-acid transaminase [Alphaproteobacteria bacterium]